MKRSAALALAGLVLSGTALAGATSATAASTYTTSGGVSISQGTLRAGTVELTTVVATTADRVEYRLDGALLAAVPTTTDENGRVTATAVVDLSGYTGSHQLVTRTINGKIGSSITKSVVIDATGANELGYPSAINTGVPAGVKLTEHVGNIKVTTPGTVLSGLDIKGCVTIAATDVTIENSKVSCTAREVIKVDGGYRFNIKDSEVDGLDRAEVGIGYANFTASRVNVHSSNDGIRFGFSSSILDSWVHDSARKGDLHPDAIQTTSGTNIVIRGNHLDPSVGTAWNNAAIMMGSETGSQLLKNVVIEDNLLGGGNYTLSIKASTNAENVVVTNNVFKANRRYGEILAPKTNPNIFISGYTRSDAGKVRFDLAK
jgi:hypothetical protein